MHAIAAQQRSFRRDLHALNAAARARRNTNRQHDRALVANLCDLLASADLTATSYRLALSTISRMMRRGSATEATPVETIAQQLGVHRNAVTKAYTQLEAAGIVHRKAVKHRGAPTRTTALGFAAELVTGKLPSFVNESEPTGPSGPDSGITSIRFTAPSAPLAVVKEDAPTAVAAVTPAERGGATGFIFNAAVNASMFAKVPVDMRMRAMQLRDPSKLPVDPAWNLTDGEAAHFRALFPKPEAPERRPLKAPTPKVRPTPELASALVSVLPQLAKLSGSTTQAHVLADQIAYQTICGGLGRGDVLKGVRAGVRLVETKRWTEPRDWASQRATWGGITLRATVNDTHTGQGDARKNVH